LGGIDVDFLCAPAKQIRQRVPYVVMLPPGWLLPGEQATPSPITSVENYLVMLDEDVVQYINGQFTRLKKTFSLEKADRPPILGGWLAARSTSATACSADEYWSDPQLLGGGR
jgi:hypothetical protein